MTRDEAIELVKGEPFRRRSRRRAYIADLEAQVRAIPKSRVWFWKPSWYWLGWRTLVPFVRGHDEYSRETVLFGWTITGRVIIATNYCGNPGCYKDTLRWQEVGDD